MHQNMSSIFDGMDMSGGGGPALPVYMGPRVPRVRRLRGNPLAISTYNRKRPLSDDARSVAARTSYFQDPALQRRYYGVKRQIGYRKQYSLRDFWDMPMQRGSQASLNLVGPSFKEATEQQRMNRRAYKMTGRGKYMQGRGGFFGGLAGLLSGQGWKAGSDMGDKIWDAAKGFVPIPQVHALMQASDLANKIAQPVAQATGYGLYKRGRGLYRGRGEYAVNKVITDGSATASSIVPQFSSSDVHEITYSNREFVRDVFAPTATTAFSIETWALNPGLATSFPWLSQIAINFEEYEIVQLIYTFKSTVADFAASSGQVGQVIMATQYNPNSDTFADKEEMMLHDGGMSCKTTESMLHGIECDPSKNSGTSQKYVRAGQLPPSEDLKNYDMGKTSIAIINAPTTYAGQQLGELWVSYTVKLRKPKLASLNAYNVQRDIFAIKPTTVTNGGQIALGALTNLRLGARNSLGCTLSFPPASLPSGAGTDYLNNPSTTTSVSTAQTHFVIKLPNTYSGIVRIHARLSYYNVAQQQPPKPILVSTAPDTIHRFKDIPISRYLLQENTHIVTTVGDYDSSLGQYFAELECHLRVLPPRNGVQNLIYVASSSSLTDGWSIAFSDITIEQYNSFLSYNDNGTNDQIAFVDQFTQPATWI
jgi:hypothetical protein